MSRREHLALVDLLRAIAEGGRPGLRTWGAVAAEFANLTTEEQERLLHAVSHQLTSAEFDALQRRSIRPREIGMLLFRRFRTINSEDLATVAAELADALEADGIGANIDESELIEFIETTAGNIDDWIDDPSPADMAAMGELSQDVLRATGGVGGNSAAAAADGQVAVGVGAGVGGGSALVAAEPSPKTTKKTAKKTRRKAKTMPEPMAGVGVGEGSEVRVIPAEDRVQLRSRSAYTTPRGGRLEDLEARSRSIGDGKTAVEEETAGDEGGRPAGSVSVRTHLASVEAVRRGETAGLREALSETKDGWPRRDLLLAAVESGRYQRSELSEMATEMLGSELDRNWVLGVIEDRS